MSMKTDAKEESCWICLKEGLDESGGPLVRVLLLLQLWLFTTWMPC
jgi:hypothetical protein